jgi:hypothetical protein
MFDLRAHAVRSITFVLTISVLLAGAARADDTVLGKWLPKADAGFGAWAKGEAVRISRYDYFVCGTPAKPALPEHDFHYAASACPLMKGATPFVYGTAEPIKGSIVYDPSGGIVLFNTGCCAWRGYVLAEGTGAPPQSVAQASLKDVRTQRGIELGMKPAQVTAIYGPAKLRPGGSRPAMSALYYTTMRGTPNNSPDACGQHQSFFFKQGRLVQIDLLAGC